MKATRAIQIALHGVNEAGAGVASALLEAHGVKVVGRRTFDSTGDTRVVVAKRDVLLATSLLEKDGMTGEVTPVVVARLCEARAKYRLVMELLARGVNVSYFYWLEPRDPPSLVVFKTNDDGRALHVIRAGPWTAPKPPGGAPKADPHEDCAGDENRRLAA